MVNTSKAKQASNIVQIMSSCNPIPLSPHINNHGKYRDKEAIKHSMFGDTEIDMSNSSHQEDQGGNEVLDGLYGWECVVRFLK